MSQRTNLTRAPTSAPPARTAHHTKHRRIKPAKPYPEFPLFPHATGRWAKKIRGRFAFFGPWEDPQGALERYLDQRDALHAGLVPRRRATTPFVAPTRAHTGGALGEPDRRGGRKGTNRGNVAGTEAAAGNTQTARPSPGINDGGLALRELVNRFLTAKQERMANGELGRRSFSDYHTAMARLIKLFGPHRLVEDFQPEDFTRLRGDLSRTRGPLALTADITKVKGLFKFGQEEGLIDRLPRYGPGFVKPPIRTVRLARAKRGTRMFEPSEIKKLLSAAGVQMHAMILLGLNCGMGNTDVAALPRSAVDLKTGMIDFPRPKTGITRRAILWPETVRALKGVAKVRPDAKRPDNDRFVFITKYGAPWVRVQDPKGRQRGARMAVVIDGVGLEFGKLMRQTGTYQPGRAFYGLRHTFRTVADEIGDRRAIDLIMGHENGQDVSRHYVERVGQGRLKKVSEHVRRWCFALR